MITPDDELLRDALRRIERPVDLDDAAAGRVLDRTLHRYAEHRGSHTSDDTIESLRMVPAEPRRRSDRSGRSSLMMAASIVIVVALGVAIFSSTGRQTDESQQPLQDTITTSTNDADSPAVVPPLPEPTNHATSTTVAPTTTVAPGSELPINLLGLTSFTTRGLNSGAVDGDLSYAIRSVGVTVGPGDATTVDVRFAAGTASDPAVAPHPVRTVTVDRDGTVVIPLEMLYPPAFGGPCEGGTVTITTRIALGSTVEASCAGSATEVRIESSIGESQSIDGVTATPVTYEITAAGLDPTRIVWWFDADGIVQMTYTVDGVDVDLT